MDDSPSSDLDNQMISLENPENPPTENTLNINEIKLKNEKNISSNYSSLLTSEGTQKKIAEKVVENAEKKVEKAYIQKLLCCCVNYFKKYFKIKTKEVERRLILSLKPLNNSFYEEALNNPDLYGPFWIYTTLIFAIASGGSLSKYFQNSNDNFFQKFIPSASLIIYIMGFGFPLLLFASMKFFGEKIPYFTHVCIYGYSFSCFIPIMLICSCGILFNGFYFLMELLILLFLLLSIFGMELKHLKIKKNLLFLDLLL